MVNKKTIFSSKTNSASKTKRKTFKRHVDKYSEVMRNEVSSDNLISAFLPKPKKLTIDIQAEDEQIVLLLRQHLITQVKWVLIMIFMIFSPLLFSMGQTSSFLPATYKFAMILGWYLITFGFTLQAYLKWFYKVYIITDERIIDVDFKSMIYKDISTTKIDKVEDITTLTKGFFSSVFNYGEIIVQTAATKQEFRFVNIPQPSKVSALLNEMILEEEREKMEGRVQ